MRVLSWWWVQGDVTRVFAVEEGGLMVVVDVFGGEGEERLEGGGEEGEEVAEEDIEASQFFESGV